MDTKNSPLTPLVSVIIAAYNVERWIGACLQSILNQTWEDLEVIVVDDGSTDGTAAVVSANKDPRLQLIRQTNRGQGAALNGGAAASRGNFIKFVDADDWLNERHLAAQLAVLEGEFEKVADCGWGYFVDDPEDAKARVEVTNRDYGSPLDWLVDSLTRGEGMMGGWKWLIPRVVWERSGGWDERLSLIIDFDFSIRLLLASSGVRFAPAALYAYRKGVSGAVSGRLGPRAMQSAFLANGSGCHALLAREDSPRIRRICADRWQEWLYRFYPLHQDLAQQAQCRVDALGGSGLRLEGGRLLRVLHPLVGWKAVRWLQVVVYQCGWSFVLRWKAGRRMRRLKRQG